MVNLGNWHDDIGTPHENSTHREAPNKHEKGSRAYKKMIADDTKRVDNHANLPFTFVKPPKRAQPARNLLHRCDHCGNIYAVSKYTCGIQCAQCRKYCSVNETNTFPVGDDPNDPGLEVKVAGGDQ